MHKLQTQDVQQHDKIPTVVPIHTNETHAWKSGTSKPTLNTHDDSFLLRAAVQNCNGLRREGYKCRLANSMDADKIGVCCLTETHLETIQSERWDTGHTLLTSGMAQRKGRRGSQGVGACLSKNALGWFEAGGCQFAAINGRFCSFRLLIGTTSLCFIVWCAPTSDAVPATRRNNLDHLEDLVGKCRQDEALIIMTDANAAIGPHSDQDQARGPFSAPHQNTPGTHLRTLLAMNALCAPVTYFPQVTHGTWFHPLYNQLHQCDHVFLRWKDRHVVRKVWNAAMLTSTDHCSVRADLFLKKWKKPTSTLRKIRIDKDFSKLFNPPTISSTSATALRHMATTQPSYNPSASQLTSDATTEMCSLLAAVDKTISDLPKTDKPPRGWHDVNDPTTRPLLLARNRGPRAMDHHRHGCLQGNVPRIGQETATGTSTRRRQMVAGGAGTRPQPQPTLGGSARRDPCAFWKQAQHALRGSSKWKPRQRAFTRNAAGVRH